uniref:Uncharacterized protein n=1 Tax=viral metagenome TaxID=1070528 RepID=A0A6M3Y0R1_9ZZZZ
MSKEKDKAAKPKVEAEIKIPAPTEDVETLIQKAKAEVKKPIIEEVRKKRGRPKKKPKPELDMKKYGAYPIAKTVNSFLVRIANGVIGAAKGLPLTKEEKLKDEDCEIGEALCYTFEYYGLEITHPIFVILIATGTFGWAITDKILKVREEKATIAKAMVR